MLPAFPFDSLISAILGFLFSPGGLIALLAAWILGGGA